MVHPTTTRGPAPTGARRAHPWEIHAPQWVEGKTPVVDGKYIDLKTGDLKEATSNWRLGPPAVNCAIYAISTGIRVAQNQMTFPVDKVLWRLINAVHKYDVEVDSLTATPYTVRLILRHDFSMEEWKAFLIEVTPVFLGA
ncbi:hypothetical protein O9K51_03925 [Purpureocillium lavendulum]|uniref:Uncharacterized protein n=1 Tax=Purpureocillium lavendulum TaxID=1247861 RepID=A0AB34FTZ4_9HYPO|nr:hypothetical protein O9K51_03925 [Purpureocillium lavendulum]